ncbi:MAG: ABC transporter substrate-binding protein [Rhodospirillales bacterium]|nr:ABC transporter substrate-binding protein [Rhodospirillales bacterium]
MESKAAIGVGRRTLIKTGVAVGAMSLAGPAIITARGEVPVKLGYIDPLTGVYSALAQDEVMGARHAVKVLNKKGGILGRPIELLVEDSANDVGTGVAKAHKLIDKDHVNAIFGDVNSGIAYAIAGVTHEKKVFQIVPGGHTDPITGKDCYWNVFRICNTTSMDANAITPELVKHFGKRWYFITPNYSYGHTLQAAFIKALKKLGGEYQYAMMPINASDFSATLIKAKAYKPNVLLNNMGGLAQIDCMKQFVQFGMDKQMGLGGALFEIEDIEGVPPVAQRGWWDMEWWWNQPNVPEVVSFVKDFREAEGKTPTARCWFGWVAVHSVKLAAEKAKSLKAEPMAKALAGMELPPEVKLQPGKVFYRAGDHELMPNIFVGHVHPAPKGGDKNDVFTVADLVPGDKVWPLADTGCHMSYPA